MWGGRARKTDQAMNTNQRTIPVMSGPPTRFELVPSPAVPPRGATETALDALKSRLLQAQLRELRHPEERQLVRQAAAEAASVAWFTPYPLLFFPELFAEKAREALRRGQRQAQVRRRSRQLLRAA